MQLEPLLHFLLTNCALGTKTCEIIALRMPNILTVLSAGAMGLCFFVVCISELGLYKS